MHYNKFYFRFNIGFFDLWVENSISLLSIFNFFPFIRIIQLIDMYSLHRKIDHL